MYAYIYNYIYISIYIYLSIYNDQTQKNNTKAAPKTMYCLSNVDGLT